MQRIKIVVLFFGVLFLLSNCKPKQQTKPYNVLFIAVDDLNDWVGFLHGHPQTLTPNMDKLAASGMVFDRAYCAASVCNASRAAIMSGKRPSSTGVYDNGHFMGLSPALQNQLMLPEYFAKHGYSTAARGKIYHHPNGKWAMPQTWQNMVEQTGNGMNTHERKTKDTLVCGMPIVLNKHQNFDWGGNDVRVEETSDFMNAQWIADQLGTKHKKPFFLACGIFRPHLPWYVPQSYFDKFPLERIIVPDINENDLDDVPEVGKIMSSGLEEQSDYQRVKKYGKFKEAVQAYLACINYADDALGIVLDALENSEYKDNTIVVFWGDHGWNLGQKLHYRKFVLWEEACRVPLIISVPGKTNNAPRCMRAVNLLDLYPTLVELCGLPAYDELEGNSLAPLIADPNSDWDIPSLTTMGFQRHSLRSEKYRYIRYEDGSEELYDHFEDPLEWRNLASDSQYVDLKNEFMKYLPKVNVPAIDEDKSMHLIPE